MYILDTDHLSLIQRNGIAGQQIRSKLSRVSRDKAATTIVSYEEQVKGRLAMLSRAKTPQDVLSAYAWLRQLAEDYREIVILSFDAAALLEHQQLRKRYPRLGTMDLKIAAISITRQAILLTRNQSDFGQVTELVCEDWSI